MNILSGPQQELCLLLTLITIISKSGQVNRPLRVLVSFHLNQQFTHSTVVDTSLRFGLWIPLAVTLLKVAEDTPNLLQKQDGSQD